MICVILLIHVIMVKAITLFINLIKIQRFGGNNKYFIYFYLYI